MTFTKAVAVVGFKDSGKTRVVEALVGELTGKGYRVGTLKHTAEDVPFDTPGKDTWRHREAGSEATAIMHGGSAAFFIDRYVAVNDAVAMLGGIDFVVLEGFKSLATVAKLVVPRDQDEAEALYDGLEITVVDVDGVGLTAGVGVPVVSLDDAGGIADVVEGRSFPLLSGVDCRGCGYGGCGEMARAILAGEAVVEGCVGYGSGDVSLRVNGVAVPLGHFVGGVTRSVVLGLVRSFKGVEDPRRIELEFEVGRDE